MIVLLLLLLLLSLWYLLFIDIVVYCVVIVVLVIIIGWDLFLEESVTYTSDSTEHAVSLRKKATAQIIRMMWKKLMDNLEHNIIILAGHLCQEGKITPNEEKNIIKLKNNSRDKTAELLQTVERKGWPCLVELVNAMKTLEPLRDLTREMVIAMEQCGKIFTIEMYQ